MGFKEFKPTTYFRLSVFFLGIGPFGDQTCVFIAIFFFIQNLCGEHGVLVVRTLDFESESWRLDPQWCMIMYLVFFTLFNC